MSPLEEYDRDDVIGNCTALPDQLILALYGHYFVAIGVDVDA